VTASPPGLITIGQTLATMRASTAGPVARGGSLRVSLAGAESNVAIGVRRLGVPATWVGHVGRDALGDLIVRELRAEDVDVRAARDPGRPTALLLAERRTASRRRIWYYRRDAAGAGLSPDDVERADWSRAGVVHLTGITACLGPGPAAAAAAAAARARAAGAEISVDLNYRSALASEAGFAAAVRPLVAAADVVFATVAEASAVSHCTGAERDAERLAADLLTAGPAVVVIKLGRGGSLLATRDGTARQAALPTEVVDPVGAGDAFAAGFLAARLRGADPAACLRQAACVAAIAVATEGDWEGLPSEEELLTLTQEEDIVR
jgi:2-dehydro-3-deoxygluconokinase